MKARNRSPKIGDPIIDDSGVETKIGSFFLYQVGAPSFYDVTDINGLDHKVCGWDGTAWHSASRSPKEGLNMPMPGESQEQPKSKPSAVAKISDEDHGGHGSFDNLPVAGSLPASSTDCPIKKGERASLDQVPEKTGVERRRGKQTRRCSLVGISAGAHPRKRIPKRDSGGAAQGKPRSIPEQESRPALSSTFVAANRAGFYEAAARAKQGEVEFPRPVQTTRLPAGAASVHAKLDAARDRFNTTQSDAAQEDYHRCILAVDVADPGFYLGRRNPIAPMPRYVAPDLDYAGIRSRMTFPGGDTALHQELRALAAKPQVEEGGMCRLCGCTDDDCSGCIQRTGESCHWVEPDLCSACAPAKGEGK